MEHPLRALHVADNLGFHQLVAQLLTGVFGCVEVGRLSGLTFKIANAVKRHGVGKQVGVGVGGKGKRFIAHAMEQVEHAGGIIAGGGQIFEAGLVGGGFHGALVGQEAALGHTLRSHHDALAHLACALHPCG